MKGLGFWAGLLAAALGARWILKQRPRLREPGPEGIEDREAVRSYAGVAGLPHFRVLHRWLARRSLWGVPPRGRALDLGCGPGGLLAEIAGRFPALELLGLDVSREMLSVARERLKGHSERITLEQGDGSRLPFPDASFDLVVSTLSLHHWDEPEPVLNEIARVLKPGGRFMVFDLRRDVPGGAWVAAWLATKLLAPPPLRKTGEPLGSVKAAYTPREVVEIAHRTALPPWRVASGPLWLSLENAVTP